MSPRKVFSKGIGSVLSACALVGLVALAIGFGTSGMTLAQSGAPGPGWLPTPGGGWVPPGHPLAEAAVAADAGNCAPHMLRGTYIFAASGFNIVAGVAQPKTILERIEFHGDGTLTVTAVTASINGTILTPPPGGAGVYSVQADCTGTLSFLPGPSFNLLVETTGRQVWMIQNEANTVFQGPVTRVSH